VPTPTGLLLLVIFSFTASLFVLAALGLVTFSRRLERRPPARGTLIVTVVAVGLILGDLLIFTTRLPLPRLLALATAAGLVVAQLLSYQPATAGATLVAVALPWTIWFGWFIADNAIGGGRWSTPDIVPAAVAGVAAIGVGVTLMAIGRPIEARAHPPGPAENPRRWDALSHRLLGPRLLGAPFHDLAVTVIVVGIAIGNASAIHGRPFVVGAAITVISVGIAFALGAAAWVLVRRPAERRAMEAYVYLGEYELDRFRAQVGGPAVPTIRDFRRFLDASAPSTQLEWIRSELFAVFGRLPEARASAEAMPTSTPYQRVERASHLAYIDWLAGGPGDVGPLRAAAAEVLPAGSAEALRAEVTVAIGEARVAIGQGSADPLRPLRTVRDRLGSAADGILWTALRRRAWPGMLRLSALFVVATTVLDRLASLG
jgi:hypothetical protein